MANEFLDPRKRVLILETGKTVAVVETKPPKLVPPLFGYGRADMPGVEGDSAFDAQPGVIGAHGGNGPGVLGVSANGIGIHGRGGQLAGFFDGNVQITGNLDLTGVGCDIRLVNQDCAEEFDVVAGRPIEPGTVMVLDSGGLLSPSHVAYDKRVAGVISGAGKFRPAMTLGVAPSNHKRMPIALMGKVYCWVDAEPAPVEVGDLLTTSWTEGHAMAASDRTRAFGTIVGKALEPLPSGKGLIPILVTLQ